MLAAERQRRLLELARKNGTVRTTDLAADFNVTEETIRRDLDFLARLGHLRRTHGGAMDTVSSLSELSQSERESRQLEEKIAIGREAATLVKEGETLLLDASTTALEFASQLPNGMQLRVISYSLAVIERLANREDVEVIQLGGSYERRGRRFSGMQAEMALRTLRVDRFFFSGGGYHPTLGIGEPNPDQSRFKRMMLEHSAWNCALIDHTKMGVVNDQFFAKPEDLNAMVCDQAAKPYAKKHLKNAPFELHFR
jgi:DeoR/GlpR family transcriptional regulator of sugar metabolism